MSYSSRRSLGTSDVATIFAEEISCLGGSINNSFDDGRRLFARSVLPLIEDVRTGDGIKGGVAVRADGPQAWVHPYTFRLVCQNGAIRSHAIQTRRVPIGDLDDVEVAEAELREAIRVCSDPSVFIEGADEMRTAAERHVDLGLDLLNLLTHLRNGQHTALVASIMEQFFKTEDRSQFSLMNAVTSVARQTPDPEVRWRLEELGGGIPAAWRPTPSPVGAHAEMMLA